MRRLKLNVLAMVAIAAAAGCRSLAPPAWLHPGTAEQQQYRAQQFDPYPENESGPTVVGARPLEYDKPPDEVLRVQPPRDPFRSPWFPWNWRWR